MRSFNKSIYLTGAIVVIVYLLGSSLAFLFSLKHSVDAKNSASLVLNSIEAGEYDRALEEAVNLDSSLASAKSAQKWSFWLKIMPVFRHDYSLYSYLLSSSSEISSAITDIVNHLNDGNISKIIALDALDLAKAGQAYLAVHEEVISSFDHLVSAAEKADKIHTNLLPSPYKEDLEKIQTVLLENKDKIQQIRPLIDALPVILGESDPYEILVLLQNSDELRPTGGFIGNYGKAVLDQGLLQEFFTADIYNIDEKALGREEFQPPEPIKKFLNVDHWYLRDANWSPDYPTSAQDIQKIYESESQVEGIDTILALTPYIVEEFMKISGPIELNDLVFTSENLIDVLQYRVEYEFGDLGLHRDERKAIINDLAKILKQRFFAMDKDELLSFISILNTALDRKEILIYTVNPQHQKIISSLGWDGGIEQVDSDYLYIVDANVAALKTDRVVDRERSYTLSKENGKIKANLRITYHNKGNFDYRTTRYRSYVRIYVPISSELISSSGFMKEDKSSSYVDPLVYSEFNKTVFAGFISIEPGQSRYIDLQYYLPNYLVDQFDSDKKYSLYLQKQPGVNFTKFDANININETLFSFSPSDVEYEVIDENKINFTDYPVKDMEFVVKYK